MMNQFLKKLMAGMLAFLLIATMIPMPAEAAKREGDKIGTMQMVHVNPLERERVSEEDLYQSDLWMKFDHPDLYAEASEEEILCYYAVEDVAAYLRDAMEARQEVIEVGYITENLEELTQEGFMDFLLAFSLLHTGEPTEGDYLFWQLGDAIGEGSIYEIEAGYAAIMTFQMSYYTTYEQEQEVTEAVNEFLASYYVDKNRSDYYLIKTAYKYICDNVTYDYDNLEDLDYTLKHTAYAAIIDGTAVCQGYALLLYRLALELGVDCRLISGTSGNEAHGWNIVRMADGNYYNADSTWDVGLDAYEYFLVSDANFAGHDRDESYASADFYEEYPMGAEDYPIEEPIEMEGQYYYSISGEEAHIKAYLRDETEEVRVPDLLDAHTVVSIDAGAYEGKSMKKVTILPAMKTIGENAFANCGNLTEIYFWGDAPEIAETAFTGVTAVAYYPGANETWTEDLMKDYGGDLTWKPFCPNNTHNFVVTETIEATCTEGGTEKLVCSYCGEEKINTIHPLDHDWDVVVVAPGHTESTCKRCGEFAEEIQKEWFEYESDWYYREENGELVKGWFFNKGGWFYMNEDGKMHLGWLEDDGKTYYMDSSGRMKTGWLLLEGEWYFFTESGELKTGWLLSNGIWYYMDEEGKMYIGWLDQEEGRYYLDSAGSMKTGWLLYEDKWYYFDETGILVTDSWIGDDYVDEDGVWIPGKENVG